MKTFFKIIWAWIVSIFKDNYIVPTPELEKEKEDTPKIFRSSNPRTRPHNNRRATKGRHIQVMPDRVIFHEAK